jgi:hypothetical protein
MRSLNGLPDDHEMLPPGESFGRTTGMHRLLLRCSSNVGHGSELSRGSGTGRRWCQRSSKGGEEADCGVPDGNLALSQSPNPSGSGFASVRSFPATACMEPHPLDHGPHGAESARVRRVDHHRRPSVAREDALGFVPPKRCRRHNRDVRRGSGPLIGAGRSRRPELSLPLDAGDNSRTPTWTHPRPRRVTGPAVRTACIDISASTGLQSGVGLPLVRRDQPDALRDSVHQGGSGAGAGYSGARFAVPDPPHTSPASRPVLGEDLGRG